MKKSTEDGLSIIVQARMTSTRLPGKVLKPILGRPMMEFLLERLSAVRQKPRIIVATTINAADEPIVEFCDTHAIGYYRGSEHDVLGRYFEAARKFDAQHIMRITSDCPVIDPEILESLISLYFEANCDYVSNTLQRTYPRGMDAEIFSMHALADASNNAVEIFQREHVTPYIYQNPQKFTLKNLTTPRDCSNLRLTVDTPEDYELITKVYSMLYQKKHLFNLEDILQLFEKNPELENINAHVAQKELK